LTLYRDWIRCLDVTSDECSGTKTNITKDSYKLGNRAQSYTDERLFFGNAYPDTSLEDTGFVRRASAANPLAMHATAKSANLVYLAIFCEEKM